MKILIFTLLNIVFISNSSLASDSTNLTQSRIQKLKEFSHWLSTEAKSEYANEGIYYQYDSASNKNWFIFDNAINIFFNKRILDSIRNTPESQDDILGPSMASRMLKGMISRLNFFSQIIGPDSLKFKPFTLTNKSDLSNEDNLIESNTIIQYFVLNERKIDYLLFYFEDGTTKLVSIIIAEPQDEDALEFSQYLHKLTKQL